MLHLFSFLDVARTPTADNKARIEKTEERDRCQGGSQCQGVDLNPILRVV